MQHRAATMEPVNGPNRDIVENRMIWVERRAGHDLPISGIARQLLDGGLSMTRHCLRNQIQRFTGGFDLAARTVG
jgi:hypothetical protein